MQYGLFLFLILFSSLVHAVTQEEQVVPERRKSQFLNEPGYLVIPAPYSMPGVGNGVGVYAGLNNYFGYSDLFWIQTGGAARGTLLGLWDLHLIKEVLFVDITRLAFNKVGQNQYAARGMDSQKNDFYVSELNYLDDTIIKTTLSFFDRRLELILNYLEENYRAVKLRDPRGDVIAVVDRPEIEHSYRTDYKAVVDLTDDRQDPRRGLRATFEFNIPSPESGSDPEYTTLTTNLTGYIPMDTKDTFVLNYYRSDAYMQRRGETDRLRIAENLGYDCTAGCSAEVDNLVDTRYLHNTHGNARSLGGENILRSYPGGRFSGAHAQLLGTEYRWNLKADRKPVDLFFMRDIRTGLQITLFHEVGTVSDDTGKLWEKTRASTGAGVRLIMGSGFVYRFDYATGDEGEEMSIYVSYPWEDL